MTIRISHRKIGILRLALFHSHYFFVLISSQGYFGQSVDYIAREEAISLRNDVRDMFYHGFDNYMKHAFPLDELRPMSCSGENSLGEYSLTLVDSLDSLALLGNFSEFRKAVTWLGKNLDFDKNKTVSVFETNIRMMGGLLSGHLLASDLATGMYIQEYDNELLHLAEDLGHRLLPAFDTPTGIPYGSVNLRHGVMKDETKVTSTAGGGTLLLEFGVLSRLTGNPIFEEVAKTSLLGLWSQKSSLGLIGAHIDTFSGHWTQQDSGIGTSIDSFFEYLIKGYFLLKCDECFLIFNEAYDAVMKHVFVHKPWYVEVQMYTGMVVWPVFNSLQAFWPGLQALIGDIENAIATHRAFFSVWRKYGFTPEGYNLAQGDVQTGQKSYPLRPELIESTYWLYRATRDPWYLTVGRDILTSLQLTKCRCGYCHVQDVNSHALEDHMESFFLSETVKYLYLLFDLAVDGDNLVENGPYEYVFSTEGHLFPITPQISLADEHCTYEGSFCTKRSVGSAGQRKSRHEQQSSQALGGFCAAVSHQRRMGIDSESPPPPAVKETKPIVKGQGSGIQLFGQQNNIITVVSKWLQGIVEGKPRQEEKVQKLPVSPLVVKPLEAIPLPGRVQSMAGDDGNDQCQSSERSGAIAAVEEGSGVGESVDMEVDHVGGTCLANAKNG